jgi:hypothetical protein
MATAAPARPSRARALQIDTPVRTVNAPASAVTNVTPEMVKKAQDILKANETKNDAASVEKKAVTDLNKLMIAGDVKEFAFTVELKTGFVKGKAEIAESTGEYIDVALLRTLVDDATFMKIVDATKGKTKELAGENIVIKCTRTETKPASLKVSKVKE